ncbi:V-type ATP synthase subunit I [Legionella saoudiensis]|uniref:V-type ATP synthase subunit I n=1 Tax=Legionella saoudiensis TaxID=1750561 RepID=UPI0007318BF8|nr:V-type ATPase 116kDa subunit family protein [Legionella saoudiensis]
MSIAAFKKVTLLGLSRCKSEILRSLQKLGCLQLITINSSNKSALTTPSTTLLDQIKTSLRYLQDSPEQGTPRLFWKNNNADQVVKQILENQQALKNCIDRRDFLTERIHGLSEWGHFELPDEADLRGIKLWFYKIPLKQLAVLPKDRPIQKLYQNNLFIYIVILAEEEPQEERFSSYRIHTGAIALNDLLEELDELDEQIEDLIEARRSLSRFRYLLAKKVAQFADRSELQKASEKTMEHQEFFVLQGWVPESQVPALCAFCREQQIGLTIDEPLEGELPPTLLESNPWLKGGQELVRFYQTPGYHALDPSISVFFSFSIFFAIILADAGYGLILALFTLLGWKRLGKYNAGQWIKPLLVAISTFSIIYGVLLGSYWGVEPKKGTFLASLHLLDIHNFKNMMMFTILIGCIHICIGCGLRIWFSNSFSEKMQALGFIILISAVLIFSAGTMQHKELLTQLGTILLGLSILMVMFFASDEQVIDVKSFARRVGYGLASVVELPSLFGDILSYLRLFALGLAGASMAITFNTIAHSIAPKSWVLALLVLLAGQALNFGLCVMSAVIHGLRLNYIEFFKWSIKEDGYSYQPFKKQEISHE